MTRPLAFPLLRFETAVCLLFLGAGVALTYAPAYAVGVVMIAGCTLAVSHRFGIRTVTMALALLVLPPGVVGENSSFVAALALVVIWLMLRVLPGDNAGVELPYLLAMALVGAAFVAAGVQTSERAYLAAAVLYFLSVGALHQAMGRSRQIERALQGLTALVVLECLSYFLSMASSFRFGPHDIALKHRHVEIYAPFTITSGSGGYWPSLPRLTLFSGEPGLGAAVILIALLYTIRGYRGKLRVAMMLLLGSGILFTQSTAALFALVAFGVASGMVQVTRRLTLFSAVVGSLALIPVLDWVANQMLDLKAETNTVSLADRGFATAGQYKGDISLIATLQHHAYIALPVFCLISYLIVTSIRSPAAVGLVTAIAVIALYSQPLQAHPGIWMLLILVVRARDRGTGDDVVSKLGGIGLRPQI